MKNPGVAYEDDGVRITHFPAVHARDGSISYRLEWNGLSMVFSGDTRPNEYMLQNAKGVDVLVHEMVLPPETWAEKNTGLQPGDLGWERANAHVARGAAVLAHPAARVRLPREPGEAATRDRDPLPGQPGHATARGLRHPDLVRRGLRDRDRHVRRGCHEEVDPPAPGLPRPIRVLPEDEVHPTGRCSRTRSTTDRSRSSTTTSWPASSPRRHTTRTAPRRRGRGAAPAATRGAGAPRRPPTTRGERWCAGAAKIPVARTRGAAAGADVGARRRRIPGAMCTLCTAWRTAPSDLTPQAPTWAPDARPV